MAEGVGFEPTDSFPSPVFKTGAIDHSTTPPVQCRGRDMPGRTAELKQNSLACSEMDAIGSGFKNDAR